MIEKNTLTPMSIDAETNSEETLKACWGLGNRLYLSHGCKPHRDGCSKPQAASISEDGNTIFNVEWNLEMKNENMRELVCQSRYIFLQVQEAFSKSSQSPLLDKQLTNKLTGFSQEYRSVIRTCTKNLRSSLKDSNLSMTESEELGGCLEVFDMFEMVWNLVEVLFLYNNQHGMGVVSELMQWYKVRFHNDLLHEQVLNHSSPHQHPLYWNLMMTLVLQGSMQEACHLLDTHPDQSKPFQTMHFLISNMPVYTQSGTSEWTGMWRRWKVMCEEHVQDAVFADHQQLHQLARILAGEDSAFTEHLHLLPSWYGLLISRLFFQQPFIPASDLRIHAPGCIECYEGQGVMTVWDDIILCVIQMDVKQAIATYCKNFSNWWFSSHLTDLLHHAGCIPPKTLNYGSDLREFLLLEYASSLSSCDSLNEVSLDYFSMCPVYGRWNMEEMIARMSVVSERQADKVVSTCVRYSLNKQAGEVCRREGVKAMKLEKFSSALKWCVSSRDEFLAAELVKRILQKLSFQDLHQLDILSHFPQCLTFSDHLIFLGKLVEFERLVDEARTKEGMEVMMALFNEKNISQNYWPMMFQKVLKVLQEHKEVQLNRDDTVKLMECLNEYSLYNTTNKTTNITTEQTTSQNSTYENTLQPLRLYLLQSLALDFL